MRKALILLAVLAAALPFGLSQATHCDTQIYLFSRVQAQDPATGEPVTNPATGSPVGNPTYHSGSVGCAIGEPDLDNTDVIYPGANAFSVRFVGAAQPTSGTVTFAGTTYNLTFAQDPGAPINSTTWDTKWFTVSSSDTIAGNTAVVTVCVGGSLCTSRTYRTAA